VQKLKNIKKMYAQPLNMLKAGEKGVIVALGNDSLLRNRLIDRGVMNGDGNSHVGKSA
jgi:hypothetical protein